jgi:hypothetical protein
MYFTTFWLVSLEIGTKKNQFIHALINAKTSAFGSALENTSSVNNKN